MLLYLTGYHYLIQKEDLMIKKIFDNCIFYANKNKLKVIFLSGYLNDFWANWYSYAIVHDWIILQAILGFFLPIINFPFALWFINETDTMERFRMTIVTAFAMCFGSTTMLLMIRMGIGVGNDFIP